jgi:uncharacterized DUF497 family protein
VGGDGVCSWDDGKRALNLANHGYDFADVGVVFDGRAHLLRSDTRQDYGEPRFNMLVMLRARIINVTFTPRGERRHLISVRPASREERRRYHDSFP